jgi:hypothetical protein
MIPSRIPPPTLCLIAALACGRAPTSAPPAPVEQTQHALTTQSILLVAGSTTLTAEDVLLKQRLETLVPSVVVVDHNTTAAAATGRSMVLISASVDNLILTSIFRDVAVPVMLLKRVLVSAMSMASTSSASSSANTMELFGFTGLTSPLSLTSASTPIAYVSTMAPGAIIRARRSPDVVPTMITAFSIETGAAMITGTAPARRMLWPGLAPAIPLLTTAGWQFFDESVKWTIGGLGDSECCDGAIPIAEWHQVAGPYDGSTNRFYVNSILRTQFPSTGILTLPNGADRRNFS